MPPEASILEESSPPPLSVQELDLELIALPQSLKAMPMQAGANGEQSDTAAVQDEMSDEQLLELAADFASGGAAAEATEEDAFGAAVLGEKGSFPSRSLKIVQGDVVALKIKGVEGTSYTLEAEENPYWIANSRGQLVVIRGLSVGKAALKIHAEKEGYQPTALLLEITVTLPPVKVELSAADFDPKAMSLVEGGTAVFNVSCEPKDAKIALEYDQATMTAAIDKKNTVTLKALKQGNATLKLIAAAEGYEDTVIELPVKITGEQVKMTLTCPLRGASNTVNLNVGGKTTVTVGVAQGATFTHAVSGDAIEASLSGNILNATALKAGKATVTFTASKEGLADNTQTLTFVVGLPKISLTVNPGTLWITMEQTGKLSYTVSPSDAVVTAKLSSPIASVSVEKGSIQLEPLKAGSGVLTLTAKKDGYADATQTVQVLVNKPTIELTLSKSYVEITSEDASETVSVTVKPANATLSVSTTGGVTADLSGKTLTIRADSSGSVRITASKDGYADAQATVTVTYEAPLDLSFYVDEVYRLTNYERAKHGLAPLERMSDVEEGAQIRAKEIVQSFSHTRPNGKGFYTVFGIENNYYFGENIAMGYLSPYSVMEGWMNSPGHRANILESSYVGLGVGVYQSGSKLYWVQIFRNSTSMRDSSSPKVVYYLSDYDLELQSGESYRFSVINNDDSDFTVKYRLSSGTSKWVTISQDGVLEILPRNDLSGTSRSERFEVFADIYVNNQKVQSLKCSVSSIWDAQPESEPEPVPEPEETSISEPEAQSEAELNE